ncbi:FadR/GntR family transcriptional regulator [Anaerocolumna aminovalerica]|mgnify:CR=1 FL=1|uniref:DNA-binding transcriptional regulator, FadR family n=1 Tax=Anaerocolumna aminovalerica TaxID=1527 RepID=A0A1I5C458_9FIRM|nr:FCD domain-containing protein [Anaerocolumna aminovalerica]MBU5334412.1 FCD domain-containing protein [Anaerocolumna aminovalerica]MDU6263015.1 FCD domain-containing protein [Anaerocolumna aminovalerica]SFN81614.1 DNA-binding transcriptional regulator, FadR family [Anaerocolumna aminovalerica]
MYINQASDIAYDYIVEQIRSGKWKPGDKIATESQLVEIVGVSKAAIRNAIQSLVALSILKKVQGSGTYVEQKENMSIMSGSILGFDDNFLLKILEFRKMFDSYNVQLFIEHATDEDIKALDHNYVEMVAAKDDMREFHQLDQIFHNIIANGTRNPMIIQISEIFMNVFVDNQKMIYHNTGPESAIKYHGKILEAIKERNPEVASIYARMAIETSITNLSSHKKENKKKGDQDNGECDNNTGNL